MSEEIKKIEVPAEKETRIKMIETKINNLEKQIKELEEEKEAIKSE